jgi:hypothetical protein
VKQKAVTSFGDYILDTTNCNAYTNVELTIGLRVGFRRINQRRTPHQENIATQTKRRAGSSVGMNITGSVG